MPTLVRCALVVEVAGRPLPANKSAKEVGLQIADPGSGVPLMRVLGKKRDIQLASRDVQQVLVHAIDKGRLALVTKTGMKIMMSEAQPSQLEFVVRSLKESEATTKAVLASRSERIAQPGSSAMHVTQAQRRHLLAATATPMKAMRSDPLAQEQTNSIFRRKMPSDVMDRLVSMVSSTAVLASFYGSCKIIRSFVLKWHAHRIRLPLSHAPDHILEQVLSYQSCAITLARLSETCKQLESFVLRRRTELHLRAPQRAGIPTELLVQRVVRHPTLCVLDLSGYTDLRAPATVGLAKVLGQSSLSGEGIRTLRLRGCKYLSDVAVQRLLLQCPNLEVLDILEIPRLSNRALDAPLSALRILAAGSLGARVVAEKAKATLLPTGSVSALGSGESMQAQRGTTSSQLFTSKVLSRFAKSPNLSEVGICLTHAILPNCSEFEILPQLPRTIQHLDLRCANLQIPAAAVDSWKPFAICHQLTTVILSGNTFLSSAALLGCLRSIPSGRMNVLDLSGTRAEPSLFADLPAMQGSLTHLRVAHCVGLGDAGFVDFLRRLPSLEVLDVSGCRRLERPLADMVVLAADGVAQAAAGASAPKLRKLGLGQTELATYLDSTKRSLALVAPAAEVLNGSLELFDGYKVLPPKLL